MAKVVVVEVKTKGINKAAKEVEGVSDAIDGVTESTEDATKASDDLGKGLKKAGDGGKKGLGLIKKGFKGIGTAIKAAGIGLVIGLFAALKEVLEQQQPVLDLVDTTMTAIGLAIGEVSKALGDAFTNTNEATGGFDALTKVLISWVKIGLTPIQLAFQGIKLSLLSAQLNWEQSFFGSGDVKTIKALKISINESKDEIISLGKAAIENGKIIVENFGEAVDEVGTFTEAAVDNLKKIDAQKILSDAAATTKLKNDAKIAEAENQKTREEFDRKQEEQRQIRDDINATFEERKDASDKLKALLEEDEKIRLERAALVTAAAKAEFDTTGLVEHKVAYINAQTEMAAIKAEITGKESEQKVADAALRQEEIDDIKSKSEERKAIAEEERKAIQERVKEGLRIIDEALKTQKELEIKAIQDATTAKILALEASGLEITEAKAALLEQEKLAIEEVNDVADEKERQKQIKKAQDTVDNAKKVSDQLADISSGLFEITNNRLDAEEARLAENAEAELAATGEVSAATLKAQNELNDKRNEALKKQFKTEQAFAITESLINGSRAVMRILAETPKGDFGIATAINIGLAAAVTAAQIGAIASRKFSPTGGVSGGTISTGSIGTEGGSPGPGSAAAPDIAQGTQFTQQELFGAETETIDGGGPGSRQTKVVVLESDITNTQNRVNVAESNATFGE